jgi:hypothetical protein
MHEELPPHSRSEPPGCRSERPISGVPRRKFRRPIAPRSCRRATTAPRSPREIGSISDVAPEFPLAAGALAPLRASAEAQGSGDFSPMWAGQAAALGRAMPAGELTRALAAEALQLMRTLASSKT